MNKPITIDKEQFKIWLSEGQIRPASLEDVWGTHHNRPCYSHPNTGQPYVAVKGTEAAKES